MKGEKNCNESHVTLPVDKRELGSRAKAINYVERPGTLNKRVAQNWFRSLKESSTKLENKPRSG